MIDSSFEKIPITCERRFNSLLSRSTAFEVWKKRYITRGSSMAVMALSPLIKAGHSYFSYILILLNDLTLLVPGFF